VEYRLFYRAYMVHIYMVRGPESYCLVEKSLRCRRDLLETQARRFGCTENFSL